MFKAASMGALLCSGLAFGNEPCPTCADFPPYEQLDCSDQTKHALGGACGDMHPGATYCALRTWIASHDAATKDYDFAVQSEQIMRQVFAGLPCDNGKPMS